MLHINEVQKVIVIVILRVNYFAFHFEHRFVKIMLGKCVSGQGSSDDITFDHENLAQVGISIYYFVISVRKLRWI